MEENRSDAGREGTVATLEERGLSGGYFEPTYVDYGFANVPDTVAAVLGAAADRPLPSEAVSPALGASEAPVEHVVVVLVDGYGWDAFERDRDRVGFLDRATTAGAASPLTSTFPSETAAAMTTLYTGLQPVEHGLLGWFALLPDREEVAYSLPFATLGGEPLDEAYGLDESALFDLGGRRTLVERLRAAGIEPAVVQPEGVADSRATRRGTGDAERLGYGAIGEGAARVRRRIADADRRTYHLLYDPSVDAAAHEAGTGSEAHADALGTALDAVETQLVGELDPATADRTLLVLTADHGHVNTDPERNVRLDLGGNSGGGTGVAWERHLRPDGSGGVIPPAGSPRNVQLHVREGHAGPLRRELEAAYSVRTYTREEYRGAELFGDREPGPLFERRAPDLLAVHESLGMWWDEAELDLVGMHGGLHPDEMLVPFITVRAGDV